jgi:hypothetical protein
MSGGSPLTTREGMPRTYSDQVCNINEIMEYTNHPKYDLLKEESMEEKCECEIKVMENK